MGFLQNEAVFFQVVHPDFFYLELIHEGVASLRIQQDPGHAGSHFPKSKQSDAEAHELPKQILS